MRLKPEKLQRLSLLVSVGGSKLGEANLSSVVSHAPMQPIACMSLRRSSWSFTDFTTNPTTRFVPGERQATTTLPCTSWLKWAKRQRTTVRPAVLVTYENLGGNSGGIGVDKLLLRIASSLASVQTRVEGN